MLTLDERVVLVFVIHCHRRLPLDETNVNVITSGWQYWNNRWWRVAIYYGGALFAHK